MKRKKKQHLIVKSVLITAAVAAIPTAYILYGNRLFRKLFQAKQLQNRELRDVLPDAYARDIYDAEFAQSAAWYKESKLEKVRIKSFDGLELAATKIVNHPESPNYILLCHGYAYDHNEMLKPAREFDALGFNILLIDLRSYGESAGKYLTGGFKESLDILNWVDYLLTTDPQLKIGLYGLSLGGAAILKYLSYQVPENILFAIVDSVAPNFNTLVRTKTSSYLLTLYLNFKYHYTFKIKPRELDLIKALKHNKIPILYLHGVKDEILKTKATEQLYAATRSSKRMVISKKGNHTVNYFDAEYYLIIKHFLHNILTPTV